MKAKQDKYIDLNQFIRNKSGNISWVDNVGKPIVFSYNDIEHTIKIIKYLGDGYLDAELDNNMLLKHIHTTKITGLMFSDILYKPDYTYNVGDIVNNLLILEQCRIEKKTPKGSGITHVKGYKCRCLNDGYEFSTSENELLDNHGCPVCCNRVCVKGINDIATTDPHLVQYFVNVEDAYTHTRSSMSKVLVRCPYCGYEKLMQISELTKCCYVTCDKCSDGISYPNKFAHELFEQLSEQYLEYESEYSPEWAGKLRYDNYIKLLNNNKIIVEMDGGQHSQPDIYDTSSDEIKDQLAVDNDMTVIRINCDYTKISERFNVIKNNTIESLSQYFDLSEIDWDKCNRNGISSKIIDVVNYYQDHPCLGLPEIAKHFHISMGTMYNYMYVGEELGLFKYVRNDPKRIKNSKPVAMYNLDMNFIGIFKSAKEIELNFPDEEFNHRSIRKHIQNNKPYKGYIFKFVTFEEYQAYNEGLIFS